MKRFIPVAGAVAALALLMSGTALAAGTNPSPTGELLTGGTGLGTVTEISITCQNPTTGSGSYTMTGVAEGPYPGTFTESGTIVVSGGFLTSFSATFTVFSGATTITGTKGGPVNLRGTTECLTPSPDNGPDVNFFHAGPFDATFQLTISGPLGTNGYSGTAANDINFTNGALVSGGMQEQFLTATPVPPPVSCDSQADTDNDGLTATREAAFGTSPSNADSDSDGIKDGNDDANHNGVADEDEDDGNNNQCDVDSDQDGIADEDEDDQP